MTDTSTGPKPDWRGFAEAILEEWPVGDIDGADLFDMAVSYGMVAEVGGGYNPSLHIDAYGVDPERGDPWYEYTYKDECGPGQYSVLDLRAELATLTAENERLKDTIQEFLRDLEHEIDVTKSTFPLAKGESPLGEFQNATRRVALVGIHTAKNLALCHLGEFADLKGPDA